MIGFVETENVCAICKISWLSLSLIRLTVCLSVCMYLSVCP